MDDGTRTHDDRNHNPGLYQLSYTHHCPETLYIKFVSALARLAGLEPATLGLEGRCSIRLSYRRPVLLNGYPKRCIADLKLGRGRGIRTPDPLLPKQMRYQTAPCPDVSRPLCTGVYYSCPPIEPQDDTGALNSSQFES